MKLKKKKVRYTEKWNGGDGDGYTCVDYVVPYVIEKLGQLEDIEDELGIDLIAYHKLMHMLYCSKKTDVFVKDGDTIVKVDILEIDYCKKKIIFYKDKNYNDDYIYGFHQYGKTWALTKEELQ